MISDDILLNIFVKKNLIQRKDVGSIKEGAKKNGVSVRKYLLDNDYVTESNELDALSEYYKIPSVELDMLRVDKSLSENFSPDYMKKNKFLPVFIDENGVLIVAVADPLNVNSKSALTAFFDCPTDMVLTTGTSIEKRIDTFSAEKSMKTALTDLHRDDEQNVSELKKAAAKNEDYIADTVDNPGVRLVDSIIKEAIPSRASDIHIEPFEKFVRVRYRIDGELQERTTFPISAFPAICARIKIMSGIDIAERRIPQDGRINVTVGGEEYDFRVSTLPSVYGEKFVIRILDKTSFKFTRKDLGFTEEENVLVDKMHASPHGII